MLATVYRRQQGLLERPLGRSTVLLMNIQYRRHLRDDGMRPRRPYLEQILTQRHRRDRLAWAKAHSGWARQRWATVLFWQTDSEVAA